MDKKQITKSLLLAAAGVAVMPVSGVAAPKKGKKEAKKPNIIFIMSDDHTSQAIGVYGSRLASLNPTPVIDELASEGIVFDNVFCNNSISTPSRASIITGQYSHTNGVISLDERLRPDQQYLTKELKSLGYQSAIVGKWHLGCEPTEFDYYSVFTEAGEQGKYFDPLMAHSDNKSKAFPDNTDRKKGHSSDIVTDVTLNWLKTKRDPNKPFVLMHHYKAPHDDFEFAPRYKDYLADTKIPIPETLLDREGFGSAATRGYKNSLEQWIGTSISSRNVYRSYVEMYNINTGDDEKNTIAAYEEYLRRYLRCVKGVDD
ncbi:MAG: sulfatase-like hydrolase/transferase, partial [Rikenellaceae bacterium]